uniref:AIG1-type G domain-containing protein n=1 Tax=Poecilia reticulata TaxID=8081 RepID=A0A3P9PS91_POERE
MQDRGPYARKIVLLGRTGTGRSSAGNTILGRPAFWVELSPSSVTTRCRRQTGTAGGRSVSVIDTPGFFHTHLSPQEVMAEVGQSVSLYSPGPHVFLVTLQLGRYTQEERETLEWIKVMFGAEISRFAMVLFTWGDQLRGKSVESFLDESPELSGFVSSCHGGYHVFDNSRQEGTSECPEQALTLLKKIDEIVSNNRGSCYSNVTFKEAESTIREAWERILEERGSKLQAAVIRISYAHFSHTLFSIHLVSHAWIQQHYKQPVFIAKTSLVSLCWVCWTVRFIFRIFYSLVSFRFL